MPSNYRNDHHQGSGDDNVVDAAPDPITVEISNHQQAADEEAAFAEAEAEFSVQEHRHAQQLTAQGRRQEAAVYEQESREHMVDATRVMKEANEEERRADTLREEKKQKLTRELQRMSDQSLTTLSNAVSEVRLFVERLAPADMIKVGLATGFDKEHIDELRERAIITGNSIEAALTSEDGVRSNPYRVILDLVSFTAAVMTFADHLPALMELVQRFGQLLLQFHM